MMEVLGVQIPLSINFKTYFDFGICNAKVAVGRSFCFAFAIEQNRAKITTNTPFHMMGKLFLYWLYYSGEFFYYVT